MHQDHWTVETTKASSGCTVIIEGNPPPAAPTGRMSFQNFNPTTERLQKELEVQNKQLKWIREYGEQCRRDKDSGAEISAEEMAKKLKGVDLLLKPEVTGEDDREKEGDQQGQVSISGSGAERRSAAIGGTATLEPESRPTKYQKRSSSDYGHHKSKGPSSRRKGKGHWKVPVT